MKAFRLTGNIGCGKSTVASLLSLYPNTLILDCDRISKEIISSDMYRKEVNTILGIDVFPDGRVDFKAIAKIIFSQSEKRKLFEEFLHPLVWKIVQDKVETCNSNTICVAESAIIYETHSEEKFVAMIVATCNREEQFRRLRENRRMDDAAIQARLDQQLPSKEKERRAQFLIRTDCSLEELKDRVYILYNNLIQQKGVRV